MREGKQHRCQTLIIFQIQTSTLECLGRGGIEKNGCWPILWKRFIDRLRKNTSIFRGQWEPRGMLPCCVEEASL